MNIYFLRHGEAQAKQAGQSDAQRNLMPLGKQQAEQAAQWLGQHGIVVDVVVSSPLVRARQTAQPVAAALQIEIREDERLSGGRLTLEALAGIVADADNPDSLLLVGHEPDFSTIIGQLTGGKVDIKKATLALVTCDDIKAGSGELAWLVPQQCGDNKFNSSDSNKYAP